MSGVDPDRWEVVIGLEVHAELATRTKLFSSATAEFGGEPNTHVDPLTLGLPGSLPVLNVQAVELAIRVGLALNCTVQRSVFARKNYFYPDQPKNYQISQFDLPINADGWLELPSGQVVGIERAHLEEDTGKSTHVGGGGRIHDAQYSLVDLNRAGVPLLEIVGRPDLRDAEGARAYVSELRAVLVAVGASDGKMEEGSLRVDCNVSVRPRGAEELGTRCEIKNINSLRSLGRAIDYEAARQVDLITAGERVVQETRHWNEDDGRTHTLRSKEEADDYRYFPDPDLVELDPDPEWVERIRSSLPMLPAQRRHRLAERSFRGGLDLLQDQRADRLGRPLLVAGLDARQAAVAGDDAVRQRAGFVLGFGERAADEALDREHRAVGVLQAQRLRLAADDRAAVGVEADDGRHQRLAVAVAQHARALAGAHGGEAVGGAEVDAEHEARRGLGLRCGGHALCSRSARAFLW